MASRSDRQNAKLVVGEPSLMQGPQRSGGEIVFFDALVPIPAAGAIARDGPARQQRR